MTDLAVTFISSPRLVVAFVVIVALGVLFNVGIYRGLDR